MNNDIKYEDFVEIVCCGLLKNQYAQEIVEVGKFLNENINGTYSKFPCSFGAGASKNELTMRNFNSAVSELEVYQVTFTDNL